MSDGTRTAVERSDGDSDQGDSLARFKARLWQQTDLVVDQQRGGRRAGLDAYERTPPGARTPGGELSAPASSRRSNGPG